MQYKPLKQAATRQSPLLLLVALATATIGVPISSAVAAIDPLFADDTPIELTLNAPFREITRDRDQKPKYRPGKLSYTDTSGLDTWFDVRVRARGKSRRNKDACRFPPLRVNFKSKQVKNSVFKHQDALKLVTHCKPSARYEQYLLLEYLAYKTLNLLTDDSFRVRLLKIHYLAGDKDLGTHNGFFIEHKDRLAKRIDSKVVEPITIVAEQLEHEHTSIVELFQLMIGNTDFSLIKGPTGDVCCHNIVLFEDNGKLQPIPYDFDSTGLVNPPYAAPAVELKLKTLRQRRFRGFCRSDELLADTINRFVARKAAIYELFGEEPFSEGQALTKRTGDRAKSFFDSFYAIIEDSEQIDRKIRQRCR